VSTLLTPRLLAARRQWRGGGLGRPLVLAGVGALFLAAGYRISARILEHFVRVDPDLGRILGVKLMAFLLLVLLSFLLFSALITALSQCFLANDLQLIAAAPVPLRRLFGAKLLEVAAFASWTAVFLALPIWLAYARVFDAGVTYYLALVVVMALMVTITAAIGMLFSVALVNLFPARRARDMLSLVALLFIIGAVMMARVVRPERFTRPEEFGTWAEYLVELSSPTLPWLPSYWAARVLGEVLGLYGAAPRWDAVAWYGGALVVAAATAATLAALVFREGFRSGYSRAQESREVRWTRQPWWRGASAWVSRPFPRGVRAIIVKDAATFFRDPGQWSQLFLLLAVIAIYLYNFKVLPLDAAGGTGYFMRNLLAFLNVGLVGLVVAALAARFVLPGISLEGGTLWMLRSSPLTTRELLWAKFWGGFMPLVVVAETLVVVSNRMLHSTTLLAVLSIAAVFCLSAAIVGLAVGLGAVHPRFDAADGTEVAAGYAGILFMMLSAVLVLFSVTVLAWPVYHSFRARWLGWSPGAEEWGGVAGGLAAVAGVSMIALVTAMRRGRHSLETIDA
jgi:ABC-2 type transport system permease protein